MSEKVRSLVFYGLCVCCYVLFALYFGIIPNYTFPSFNINLDFLGIIGASSILVNDNILYPYGGLRFEGFGISVIGKIFYVITNNTAVSLSCAYLLLFTISFISLLYLCEMYSKNRVLTLFMVVIFYLDPFLRPYISIPVVGFGIMLVPFSLLLDVWTYKLINSESGFRGKREILTLIVLTLGRLFITSIGWYTAVISAVISCFSLLVWGFIKVITKEKGKNLIGRYLLYSIVPWIIAMGIIKSITPSSASDFISPLEFFNGTSVDIVTLLLPNNSQLISDLLPSVQSLIPEGGSLSGDGTQWNNYIGYCLLIGVVIAIKSKTEKRHEKISIVLTGVLGLVLALGPGIKFLAVKFNEAASGYNNYLLDFDQVIALPWKKIFYIFPLSIMRAVSRWLIIFKAAAFILAFIGLNKLWNRKRIFKIVTVLLCVGAVLEYYPKGGMKNIISSVVDYKQKLEEYRQCVIDPMKKYIDDEDIVAICSYGEGDNGYMIPYIMDELNAVSYAGAGDKSISAAAAYIPQDIQELQASNDAEQVAKLIKEVKEKKLCDEIILPFFRVNRESYYWPWPQNIVNTYKLFAYDVQELLGDQFNVYFGDYFMIVKLDDNAGDGYELIFDENIPEMKIADSSWLYNTHWHVELNTETGFSRKIDVDENDDYLWYSACLKGAEEASHATIQILEYNKNGEEIDRYSMELPVEKEYVFYEDTFRVTEGTDYIILQILANSVELKNLKISSFPEYNDSVYKKSDYDIELDDNIEFDGTNSLSLNDVMPVSVERMELSFEAFVEQKTDEYELVSKMQWWNSEMSYDVVMKEDYLVVALTEDGTTNHNSYVNRDIIKAGEWNTFEITFERGLIVIKINGDAVAIEDVGFTTIYRSTRSINIGNGMEGIVRNFKLKYN